MAQKLKDKTILLTGGCGYIGSHVFCELVEAGFHPIIIDDFSNSKKITLERLKEITALDQITCYEGSVLDAAFLKQVFIENNVQAVMHFAGKKAVGESVANPLSYFETNISGLVTLLTAMQNANVWKLVFSSSATVYGAANTAPFSEETSVGYINPYGFTKLASEQIIQQVAQAHPLQAGILRYFNPVGAHFSGLIGDNPNGVPNNLMPFIEKVVAGKIECLNIFGDDYPTTDGTCERDYIHVSDLARGHVLSLQKLFQNDAGHVVNLGTGTPHSVLDVVNTYSNVMDAPVPYIIAPRRSGDIATSFSEVSTAKDLLGFEAKYGLVEMCETSWQWVQKSNAK